MVKIFEFREAFSFSKNPTIDHMCTRQTLYASLPLLPPPHPKYPFAKGRCIPTTHKLKLTFLHQLSIQSLRHWLFYPSSVE